MYSEITMLEGNITTKVVGGGRNTHYGIVMNIYVGAITGSMT